MTTKSLQPYLDEWESLVQRRKSILGNKNLSQIGIKGELEKLAESRAGLRDRALEAFDKEYSRQARAMEANGKARGQALENSLARFENLRNAIDLETERVSRMLKSNKSALELLLDFRDSRDSGALVIAWRRALGDAPANSQGLEQLRAEVGQEYELLKNTDELQRVNEKGKVLADEALELREVTIRFMSLLSRSGDISLVGSKLQNLLHRIKISNLQGDRVYVEFGQSPDEAMQSQAQQDSSKPYFVIGG